MPDSVIASRCAQEIDDNVEALCAAVREINETGLRWRQWKAVAARASSEYRINLLMALMEPGQIPDKWFWRTMRTWWSACDATWEEQETLLDMLRYYRPSRPEPKLPDKMTVYRGCSRERIAAVSWTLKRDVAESFARGHRFIPVPDPVIVTARVKRDAVFMYTNDRREAEVLLDPDQIEIEAVEPAAKLFVF